MNRRKETKKRKVSSSQRGPAKKGRQNAFLEAFRQCATITHAAEIAKVSRRVHYKWIEKDEEYQKAFAEAQFEASDALIAEARRRAIQGVSEPVYYKGEVVGSIQKYSDTLLIFLIKGDQPEKYREHLHHTGDLNVNLVQLLNEGRDRLAKHRKGRDRSAVSEDNR